MLNCSISTNSSGRRSYFQRTCCPGRVSLEIPAETQKRMAEVGGNWILLLVTLKLKQMVWRELPWEQN